MVSVVSVIGSLGSSVAEAIDGLGFVSVCESLESSDIGGIIFLFFFSVGAVFCSETGIFCREA